MGAEPQTQGRDTRRTVSVPFASQLDDIDKALFEYHYKRQNQPYDHYVYHGHHAHQRGKNSGNQHNRNGRNPSSGFHNKHVGRNNLQPLPVSTAQNFANNINVAALKNSTVFTAGQGLVKQCLLQQQASQSHHHHQQQQQQQHHHHHYHHHHHQQQQAQQFFVQQPQPLPASSASLNKSSSNGFGYNGTVASSPDSFVEDFIHSRMSSSVNSGGSTFPYSSYDQFDLSKNQINLLSPVTSANKASAGMTNVNFNDNVFSSSNTSGFVTNTGKSLGWLNIWGNDMSVWS